MTRQDFEKASTYLTTVRLLTIALSAGLTFVTFVDDKFMAKKNADRSPGTSGHDQDVVQMPKSESR